MGRRERCGGRPGALLSRVALLLSGPSNGQHVHVHGMPGHRTLQNPGFVVCRGAGRVMMQRSASRYVSWPGWCTCPCDRPISWHAEPLGLGVQDVETEEDEPAGTGAPGESVMLPFLALPLPFCQRLMPLLVVLP